MKKLTKVIAYIRLSKPKKGKTKEETIQDAFGMQSQMEMVEGLVKQYGGKIIATYKEVENSTGKKHRPELAKAISQAKLTKATLVIAKVDRLARNLHFVTTLQQSQVEFVCCDMPDANTLTIQIMAAMAEQEARAISDRTKKALGVAKKRGVKLGSARPGHWEGREDKRGFKAATQASIVARQQKAKDAYEFLIPTIHQLSVDGKSLVEIAEHLNELGHRTTRDMPFTNVAVFRILKNNPAPALAS